MQKIFLTGASGYLGTSFLSYAHKDFDIIAFSRTRPAVMPENAVFLKGDLSGVSGDMLRGVDIVVHLAAIKGSAQCAENERKAIDANILGTRTLLGAAIDAKIKRFIFASTYVVYGNIEPPYAEEDEPMPSDIYGSSKLSSEREIIRSGIPCSILRFTHVFGFGSGTRCDDAVFNFICSGFGGKPITLHNGGRQKLDFIDVRDVCRLLNLIILDKGANGIFNVGSSRPVSISHVADLVKYLLKKGYGIDLKIVSEDGGKMAQERAKEMYVSTQKLENRLGSLNLKPLDVSISDYVKSCEKVFLRK